MAEIVSEKDALGDKDVQATETYLDNEEATEPDWTEQEEKKLVRKVDFIIMPLLILTFFTLQLNRGNIGSALTNNFFQDVGITQNEFNIGQQLLSAGIVVFEIPSNMMLYRLGPVSWLGPQIVAWGLVGTFQSFQKGLGAYLTTRLLLGICESGFIPGGLFTMTRYYKTQELGRRFSAYFLGNMVASACSGLMAYGIIRHLNQRSGLAGWQWIFLIEGVMAIGGGILFILLFPRDNANPLNLFGYQYFNERERYILRQRLILDDPSKARKGGRHVPRADLRKVFTNWRLIPHVITTIGGIAPTQGLGSYLPTLVIGMGYSPLDANAMISIGIWLLVFGTLLWGYLSDKFKIPGRLVFLGLLLYWSFTLANRLLIYNPNGVTRFAVLTVGMMFSTCWHAVHGSWLAMNCVTEGERSVTMAIHIMGANLAGIIGAQLFRQEDRPYYPKGWMAILILITFALVASGLANLQYIILNRKGKHPKGQKYRY
ncbi:hypothetical protein B0A52_00473 [Exophiala mesophila]|uniref:Major facilitator superfamily (MFS) profile domain-containing protein n=1 Tax=Exophiala mesophila TaxID=212818 RepID=A0A438NK57_EXOME|nr:hypothetical protein B0A52_00473 [Exophiala mesophila]